MKPWKVLMMESLNKLGKTIALVTIFLAAYGANAQFPANPHTLNSPSMSGNSDADADRRTSRNAQEKMAIARNDERQKRLVSDTDKLVALVTQLKTDVDKTDKYMLSLEVVRRSEEIEKLARSIKERAKN